MNQTNSRLRLAVFCLLGAVAGCASKPWVDPGSGWTTLRSEHFVLHSDASTSSARDVVERIEAVHAALSTFFRGTNIARVGGAGLLGDLECLWILTHR